MFKSLAITTVSLVALVAMFGDFSDHTKPAATPAPTSVAAEAAPPPPASCSTDWHLCRTASELVNENTGAWAKAAVMCRRAADSMAKYGEPKWPGLLSGGAFTSFRPGDFSGRVSLVEKDVQLQNGFGAWVHARAVCDFDVATDTVINVTINQR